MLIVNNWTRTLSEMITLSIMVNLSASAKCNRPLLEMFMLSGMEYSIHDKMEVCGNVIDKCCTVSDEIRISEFWNKNIRPRVDTHGSNVMLYINSTFRIFQKLMDLDPQLMVLKFKTFFDVPYEYDTCQTELINEKLSDNSDFVKFSDLKITYEQNTSFESNPLNKSKVFNIKEFTHDEFNDRHWNEYPDPEHITYKKGTSTSQVPTLGDTTVQATSTTCKRQNNFLTMEYIIVNEPKAEFCLSIYDKLLDLHPKQLNIVLPTVKNLMMQILHYKGGVYCSLCDAHQQRHFDLENMSLHVDKEFCRVILTEQRDYFHFMNVVFIEFLDTVFQYIECFESNATVYSFPFKNIITKYKRRIPLLVKCLDSIENKDFMNQCWFICKRIDLLKISPLFDGNLELIRRAYLTIFSFIRKIDISLNEYQESENKDLEQPDLEVEDNVDGLLVEPLAPHHALSNKFYFNDETRLEVLGKLDTRTKKVNQYDMKAIDDVLQKFNQGSVNQINGLYKVYDKNAKRIKQLKEGLATALNGEEDDIDEIPDAREFDDSFESISNYSSGGVPEKNDKSQGSEASGVDGDNKDMSQGSNDQHKKMTPEEVEEESLIGTKRFTNQLKHVNRKDDMHSGYYPQRILSERKNFIKDLQRLMNRNYITSDNKGRILSGYDYRILQDQQPPKEQQPSDKPQDPSAKTETNDKTNPDVSNVDKQQTQSSVADDDDLVEDVESATDFYHKVKAVINTAELKTKITDEGINPATIAALVNFHYNTTELIASKFIPEENLETDVIYEYLGSSNKEINDFNLDIHSDIMSTKEISQLYLKYLEGKKLYEKAQQDQNAKGMAKANVQMKKSSQQLKKAKNIKDMDLALKKQKKEEMDLKRTQIQQYKKEIPHHVDQDIFHPNFTDIKEFFVAMFGD